MITPARKAALTRALNEMRPGQLQRQIDQLCAELERLALSKQPASIRRVNTDFVKTPVRSF